MNKFFLCLIACWGISLAAKKDSEIAVFLEGGSSFQNGANLNLESSLLFPLDQMAYLGLSSGYDLKGQETLIPVLASLYLRMPLGRTLMPALRLDMGARTGSEFGLLWRSGAVLDLKLGDHSCLIASGGIQGQSLHHFDILPWVKGGLLLEY